MEKAAYLLLHRTFSSSLHLATDCNNVAASVSPLHTWTDMISLLLAAVVLSAAPLLSDAFVTPYSRTHHTKPAALTSSGSDDNNGPIFYDDFGGTDFGGGSSSSSSMTSESLSSLTSRMSETKNLEASYDAKLARNWRRGNWAVNGFGLEKTSASGKSAIVSVVAAPTSSVSEDISLPQDKSLPEDRRVAVGRSDGSVFIIQLGSEYLTSFVSVSNPDEPAANSQWMSAADVEDKSNNNRPKTKFGDGNIERSEQQQQQQKQQSRPFQILHQFQATEKEEPIHNLVYHDTIEGIQLICTAAGESGEIKIWSLDTSESRSHGEELVASLISDHSSKIMSLKAMVIPSHKAAEDERNVLFSASADGTVALHDLDKKGELIFSCQCLDEMKQLGQVTCADVSNPTSWDGGCDENDRDVIFLGTSSGYVVGFVAEELMAAAASSSATTSDEVCPVPSIQFRAHGNDSGAGEAVTAIRCGGHGTIPNTTVGTSRMTSKILLTGGVDGTVKQWEILAQQSTFGIRMEHWPRMSSQRMKRRHHLFKGHDGAVTSISQQSKYDSSKFLTSGNDGSIRVWSATDGEQLYTMDGFTSFVSSLACLGRDLLVTDGSGQYVCVHDFSIDDDLEAGYDLEW